MAKTAMTTSDALRKQVWEEELYRDTVKEAFFTRFSGNSADNLVHVKTNLQASGRSKTRPGDKITFGLVPILDPDTYAGVTSGQTLKGKEVSLTWYDFSLELERYRQAVSQGSPMDWQRASFNIPEEARTALKNWGTRKIDKLCMDAVLASPTKIFYKTSSGTTATATAATAKAALTAADSKLTPEMVSFMATNAKTGGSRAYVPLRPVNVDGEDFLVLLVHEDALYDWKTNATVQQANREAMERGKNNPLFRGAKYVWDNVVIFGHECVSIATDGGGSTVPWGKGILMGQQALCLAWGERPSIVEDSEDYEEDFFLAWRMTMKVGKPVFNSVDYGSVGVYYARTNVSGV